MILTKCNKGHFYDSEKYTSCPLCSSFEDEVHTDVPEDILENFPNIMPSEEFFDIPELPPELSFFKIVKKLGTGGTGTVYEIAQKQAYAVKVIPRTGLGALRCAKHEYKIAKKLEDNIHFPVYHGMYTTDRNIFIVQDVEKSWKEYVRSSDITMNRLLVIIKDIILAVISMHKKGYFHGDIKPGNILIDSKGRAKLGDFSHSYLLNPEGVHKSVTGTDCFIAPEIIQKQKYSQKEDMYSLGITMYMLFSGGKSPYDYTGRTPAYREAQDKFISDEKISAEFLKIIKKATAFSQEDRYVNLYELLGDFAVATEQLEEKETLVYTNSSWIDYQTENTSGIEDYYSTALMPRENALDETTDEVLRNSEKVTEIDEVKFSAFTDKSVHGDDYGIVEIAMYTKEFRESVLENIQEEFENSFKEKIFSETTVRRNQQITVKLSSREVEIEEDTVCRPWSGKQLIFTFDYQVPEDYSKNRIPFTADIWFDDVPATKLKFYVTVDRDEKRGHSSVSSGRYMEVQREDIRSAFLSYASQDRKRVTAILQGIQKARPDMDVFFDVEKLRSGQNWEPELYAELMRRDRLFLCWSHFARQSEWVSREWHYVLENKGLDSIDPIPMEDPQFCPPPPELAEKHFNDPSIQYRKKAVPLSEEETW